MDPSRKLSSETLRAVSGGRVIGAFFPVEFTCSSCGNTVRTDMDEYSLNMMTPEMLSKMSCKACKNRTVSFKKL